MPKLSSAVKFPCGYTITSKVRSWNPFANLSVDTTQSECPIHGKNCSHVYGMARVMLCDACLSRGIDSAEPLELGHPEVIYDGVKMHLKSKLEEDDGPRGRGGAICGARNEYMLSLRMKERSKLGEDDKKKEAP